MSVPDAVSLLVTEEVKEAYARDGFVLLRDVYTEEEMAAVEAAVDAMDKAEDVKGGVWKYYEDSTDGEKKLLNRIEAFAFKVDAFTKLLASRDEKMMAITEALVGSELSLFKEKVNFKKPGSGGFAPHQDAQAGWKAHGSIHFNVALPVDDTTLENGCLFAAAGKHKGGLLGPEFADMPADVVEALDWKPLLARRGDLIVFDSYVPHRSEPNKTDSQRRVLLSTYNLAAEGDVRTPYHADKLAHHPPDAEKEEGVAYRGYRI